MRTIDVRNKGSTTHKEAASEDTNDNTNDNTGTNDSGDDDDFLERGEKENIGGARGRVEEAEWEGNGKTLQHRKEQGVRS